MFPDVPVAANFPGRCDERKLRGDVAKEKFQLLIDYHDYEIDYISCEVRCIEKNGYKATRLTRMSIRCVGSAEKNR
jgi:hypothetical protein